MDQRDSVTLHEKNGSWCLAGLALASVTADLSFALRGGDLVGGDSAESLKSPVLRGDKAIQEAENRTIPEFSVSFETTFRYGKPRF